jgi:hypothetical protein
VSFESAIEEVLDCMCDALGAAGWEGECCLIPGTPSFDRCCEGGGEAWGRLVRAFPSVSFPLENGNSTLSECATVTSWALVVELGATTCICDDLCDCAVKAENAAKVLTIAEAALQGVLCCFIEGPCRGLEFRTTGLTPTNGLGGCGGFKIDLVMQYQMPCCPPDESD